MCVFKIINSELLHIISLYLYQTFVVVIIKVDLCRMEEGEEEDRRRRVGGVAPPPLATSPS